MSKKSYLSYLQNFTLSACSQNVGTNGNGSNTGDILTVYDKRDEKDYTVWYINGDCWMTQNLCLTSGTSTLSLDNALSNISSYNMPAESTTNFASSSGYTTDGHICSTDESIGCWYNYYAATGGTISGSSNSNIATSDICPKNWHLPSGPNSTTGTELNRLAGTTGTKWQNDTTGITAFNPAGCGYYQNGAISSTNLGSWWSATPDGAGTRFYLRHNNNSNQFFGSGYSRDRYTGLNIRCVLNH